MYTLFTDVNECLLDNGGCEDFCINNDGNFTCSCEIGYSLDINMLNCSDINECLINNGGCEHTCTNNDGSFWCSCDSGFLLDPNSLNCTG